MIYLKSTEKIIPLPSDFVDVLFTLNAIDHVNDFPAICSEIIRVIRPGRLFIGSFESQRTVEHHRRSAAAMRHIDVQLLDRLNDPSDRTIARGRDTSRS